MGNRFSQVYDKVMWPLEKKKLRQIRRELVNKAEGRVIEIGSGTGLNFPFYSSGLQVEAVEPDPMMRNKSIERLRRLNKNRIMTHLADAERLPFRNDSFDTIIATLVFCTISNPDQALKELYRVSKPGANFYLLEHVKLDNPWAARLQKVLTPFWKRICGGCHLDRNTLLLIEQSDWEVKKTISFYKGLFIIIEAGKKEK